MLGVGTCLVNLNLIGNQLLEYNAIVTLLTIFLIIKIREVAQIFEH